MSGATERLRELHRRASPPEWRVDDGHRVARLSGVWVGTMSALADDETDAELIVESRNALPELLDAAEVLDRVGRRDPADADGLCFFCGALLVGTDHCEGCLWRDAKRALARLSGDREGADR